jgi:large subunit ribosomal protein L21
MNAIIETGGKQYLVAPGTKIEVEKLDGEVGSTVVFDKVLFTAEGEDVTVGKPLVPTKTVEGKILEQGRGDKIHILKYKAKSKYRRKQGHRQSFTEVEITRV